jgi:hypothetical protein
MTVMWETTDGDNRLEYWREGDPPATAPASMVPGRDIYLVRLTGLESNTFYSYRVVTNQGAGVTYRFKTWPAAADGAELFKFVSFSDSQGNWPERLEDICENGIIDKECTDGQAQNCAEDIAAVLVAGDLVSDGENVSQWRDEFFGPCRGLFHYVPILPAIGNHDTPIENYLAYFTLPENGTPGREEEWYYADLLNLRLITLNSDVFAPSQWQWFDELLDETCDEPGIEYVLSQFHHPCKSEPWPPGENIQSCITVDRLELFTTDCGKPSAHLFGHTHAYSRGQSRDVPHLWVNVGTSAGDIDFWGEYDQKDYDEFQRSFDEYGFVVWHFTTGVDASLRMVRRTGGDNETYHGYSDATIQDHISLERSNLGPDIPLAVHPVDVQVGGTPVLLQATPLEDPEGDGHLSSHWQVTTNPGDYSRTVIDAWGNRTRFENIWWDQDTQAGIDITTYSANLLAGITYYWRVRYRDEHLQWSDWSEEATFSIAPSAWSAASTVETGPLGTTKGLNCLALIIVPIAAVICWKGMRRRR